MNTLMWFRQDLRLHDNLAFYTAYYDAINTNGSVQAVFFVTPQQWQQHDIGLMQIDFINRHVNQLGHGLAKLGVELQIVTVDDFDAIDNALDELLHRHDIQAVYAMSEPECNETQRDIRLAAKLTSQGLSLNLFDSHCAIAPGTVNNLAGEMYKVFTPFCKKWRSLAVTMDFTPLPKPCPTASTRPSSFTAVEFQLGDAYQGRVSSEIWPVGEDIASQKLNQFIETNIHHYQQQRDFPAIDGTSSLSAYLAIGVLSPRQCIAAVLFYYPDALVNEASPTKTWVNEIIWREFYRHLLVAFPRLSKAQNFNLLGNNIQWRNNETEFKAWCEGRTGFPIVDAAMTQLNQTGWMHNRLRMVVASFLTKHLLIDWRWGERYFRQHLIDGDLAANNGGWQWSAGTGCDAQPYFRVFNPHNQSERFDPEGKFITHFLPQLRHWPLKALHHPVNGTISNELSSHELNSHELNSHELSSHELSSDDLFNPTDAEAYPAMIVDHKSARLRAIEALSQLKKAQ